MLRSRLESFGRNPTRKISLNHVILPLFVLLFSGAFVSLPAHAVGSSVCAITADFHLDVSVENFNILPGSTGTTTVTVTPINGLVGPPVTLATANVPPEIISPSFSQTTLDISTPGPKTATLTFTASSTTGQYSFDITATAGSISHTQTIHVKILGPEIGISASYLSIPVPQGGSNTATISLKSLYGFAGMVDLTTSPALGLGLFHVYTPPTASVPTPVQVTSGTVTSTLTLSASGSATPGLYSVGITATSTNPIATNSTTVLIEVQGPDFAIGLKGPPSLSLPLGTSKTITLDVNSTDSFTGPVALSVAMTAFLGTAPTPTLSTQTVPLSSGQDFAGSVTFDAGGSTTAGFYFANVTGTSGGNLAHYALISIDVPEAQGFSLSANPNALTIDRQSSASSVITVTSNNLADTINLSLSCYPEEISASLSRNSVTLASGQRMTSTLTVVASPNTTPGNYEVTISGSGTTSTAYNYTIVTVTVTGPDFVLNATPSSLSIVQGSMQTSTIIMTSNNGFTSNVNLVAVAIAPSGLTASLSTTTISPSVPSILTVSVASTVRTGNYLVIITGTSGSLQHTVTISVEVTGPSSQPDFQISATTPVSFPSGSTATSTITLAPLHGFYAPVDLSATVSPTTGLTVSFNPMRVPYGNTPSTATFSSSTTGNYMVTVTGTSGSLIHSTIVRVTVTAPRSPDFDLTASPTSLSINTGDKGTTTITVTPKYGFTDNVGLSASFSAPGLTATFSPSSVSGGSGSSTLTINAGGNVAAGTYIVTVQGISGSLSHNAQVTISVPNPQSQQTSSNPQNILGLAPTMFYALTGGIIIVALVGAIGVAIRLRKPKPQ